MLSKKEYDDIVNKLNETPSTISTNTRKNLQKQRKEHEYSSKFAPFTALPHVLKFINHTTTEHTLHQLIEAANISSEFLIDTESFNVFRQANKPALIQLQIFLPHDPSFVLLIEVCHLPKKDDICFQLIQKFFQMIFTPRKNIFIFGLKNELYPFTEFELFSYDQINNVKIIDLQKEFKIFWNKKHPHQSTSSTSLTTSTNCICETCIGKRSSELWSLQDCVAYLLNEYLPKTLTKENFQIGLDPELFEVNPNEQQHRYLLSTYAKNDCLSMQRLIIQMKNNHFDFDSSSIIRMSNDILNTFREDKSSTDQSLQIRKKHSQFILPIFDDELEPISSDDDYPSEQQISNQILSIKKSLAPSTDTPETNHELLLTENSMMIHTPERTLPLFTDEHRHSHDWEAVSPNEDYSLSSSTNNKKSTSHYHPSSTNLFPIRRELSAEARRIIHNRSCTLRQRRRNYKSEIIRRNIDRRFKITQIKAILRRINVPFDAINISTSSMTNKTSLYIGIRDSSRIQTYEHHTRNLFTTDHYNELHQRQYRSGSSSHRYHHKQHRSNSSSHRHHNQQRRSNSSSRRHHHKQH